MPLKFKPKRCWGRELFYPDCGVSKAICELLKRKSLTLAQIEILKRHGLEVQYA